jgi:hypothetical protein
MMNADQTTRPTEYVDGKAYLGPEMEKYEAGIRALVTRGELPYLTDPETATLARYIHDEVSAANSSTWNFLQGETV